MLRRLLGSIVTILVAGGLAYASVWPPDIGKNHLRSEKAVEVTADRGLWDEYGLKAATEADYGAFKATAYRFKDATGAFAARPWIAASSPRAVVTGNYVIVCTGRCPGEFEWRKIDLPLRRHDEDPVVWEYLPKKDLVAGSARYVLGPVGLAQFAPEIPESAAAFRYETEVVVGKYHTAIGTQDLALLSFPAPGMAREQAAELRRLGRFEVKLTGPMVAVTPNSSTSAFAQDLLAQVNYQGTVHVDEAPAPPKVTVHGVVNMIMTIMQLAGLLIIICIAAGLGLAGVRIVKKKLGHQNAEDAMIVLHIADR